MTSLVKVTLNKFSRIPRVFDSRLGVITQERIYHKITNLKIGNSVIVYGFDKEGLDTFTKYMNERLKEIRGKDFMQISYDSEGTYEITRIE